MGGRRGEGLCEAAATCRLGRELLHLPLQPGPPLLAVLGAAAGGGGGGGVRAQAGGAPLEVLVQLVHVLNLEARIIYIYN